MVCADMNVTAMPTVAPGRALVHADDGAADDGRADGRTDDRAFINTVFIDAVRGPHGRADAPAYHHTVISAHALPTNRGRLLDDQCFSTNTTQSSRRTS